MKHKRLKLSVLLLFGLGLTVVQAQKSVNTSGGNASGSGGTASYSIGQVVYTTRTGPTGSVAQGVQQPCTISEITLVEEARGIKLTLSAYPNPTSDYLTLEVKDNELSGLKFHLYDMQGMLLQSEKITGTQTRISMNSLVPATYFIKIVQENRVVKTFIIIKN
jgi:hypothetical protein